MIVFPRGAVVKLLARARTGQTVMLTHLRTNQNVTCKVIQVNTANKSVHYVKLEFVQESQGFWGVHFPSEPLPSAQKHASASTATPPLQSKPSVVPAPVPPASPAPVSERDIFSHASVAPRPAAPLLNEKPEPTSPSAYASPSERPVFPQTEPEIDEMTFPSTVAPATPSREIPKPVAPTKAPAASKPSGYGLGRNWQKEQIEPLAGPSSTTPEELAITSLADVSPPATGKIPIPGRRPQPAPTAVQKTDPPRVKPVRPVFGELHSFSSFPASDASSVLPDASMTLSSVAHPASAPARSRSKLLPVSLTLCILTVLAAGVMFVRRHPSLFTNSGSAAAPDSSAQIIPSTEPQAAAPLQASTPEPLASSPSSAPSSSREAATAEPAPVVSSSVANRRSSVPPSAPVSEKPTRAAKESHPAPPAAAPASVVTLYAGDLNARPRIKPRAPKRMDAALPDITASVPAGISDSSDSASLGSIVPGAAVSGLAAPTAPANPEPAVRQGGDVQPPKLISSVPPVYPALAKQNNVEGDVKIQAEIGISGSVTSMKVLSGPVLLRGAAMDALRHWRYAPAKLDGKPVSTQYVVILRFRLGN
jgi:protein TonB